LSFLDIGGVERGREEEGEDAAWERADGNEAAEGGGHGQLVEDFGFHAVGVSAEAVRVLQVGIYIQVFC